MADKDFKVKAGIDLGTPLAIAEGGTGQTTANNALNALLPVQTSAANKILSSDGTSTTWIEQPIAYTRGGVSSRPGSPIAGDLYFNTEKKAFEVYTGSAWVSLITNGAVPLAPTIGTATVSGITASVPFTGPSDFGDAAITSYTATSTPGSITANSASSPISVTGLTANTSYTFTVKANNSYGSSLNSSASNSITTASVPGAPTSVTISDPGTDGYALVSWTAPASNGGSAITDYVVDYSSDSGSNWTTFSDGTSTSTSATVTGLTLNTSYIFRVKAVNLIGTGNASSSSSSFTTITHWSPEGGYDALASITLSADTNEIIFDNIPSNYKHLQIRYSAKTNRATYAVNDFFIGFNNDTSEVSSTKYSAHYMRGDGAVAPVAGGYTDTWRIYFPGLMATQNSAGPAIGTINIFDYSNTSKFKTAKMLGGFDTNGTVAGYGGFVGSVSGNWRDTSAIRSIRISADYLPFITNSTFSLYGVK